MKIRILLSALVLAFGAAPLAAAPVVENPSFEADQYGVSPGYASANGGITGWTYSGNVGINPVWANPSAQTGPSTPFLDNGAIPDGLQTALLQNTATLSQSVAGFEAGKHYVLRYNENARHLRQVPDDPRLVVRLAGQVVVVEHPVSTVDPNGVRQTPFKEVTSSVFTAPADGAFPLVFEATQGGGVTLFVDHVRIEEVADPDSVVPTYGDPGGIVVVNPGFELDSFGTFPGYASGNGGSITGWTHQGTGVGLNPWWNDPAARTGANHPFTDNGIIPEGQQALLMQNVATVSQTLPGFEAGRRYQVRLSVNARFNQGVAWPRFRVLLGGEVVVSENELVAVEGRDQKALPYVEVLSAVYIPDSDGPRTLAIETLDGSGVTLLVDDVRVVELEANAPPEWSGSAIVLPDATVGMAYAVDLAPEAEDPEGDPLAFRLVADSWSGPAGSSNWLALAEDGSLSNARAITSADEGTHEWRAKADDGNGNRPGATLRIAVAPASGFPGDWRRMEY